MTSFKQKSLLVLLAVLCTAVAWAQPYRINRHRLCIEGVSFVKKASISSQNYLFMEDFSIAAGETKTIPVYLTSSMPIWMFQADVVLPNGLTATGIDFSPSFYGTSTASQYSVESGMVDGNFRILTFNTTKTKSIPAGTRQHMFNITIKAASWLTPQSLTARISGFDFIEASTGNEYAYEGNSTSCTVTVTSSLATGITLNYSELSTYVGDQTTLVATVTPSNASQTVVWSSSKTSVATVNQNGVVTAVGEGMAVITATTTDGSNKTATCIVTVSRRLATSISISPTSTTLQVGATKQLTATVLPSGVSQNVTWRSNNTAIATVSSSGLVTARGVGSATITATTADGTNLSATCAVTVTPVMVTSVTVSPSSASILVGSTKQLSATVSPSSASNQAVSWSSSNTSVATVSSSGLVTAMAVGTATITATAMDGSGKKGTCVVTVNPVTATGISVSPTTATIEVGGTQQLTATVAPSNATNKNVTWSSSNTSVATVSSSGKVTAKAVGTATITATTADGTNLSASCRVTVVRPTATGITLNHSELSTYVGDQTTLTATVTPSGASQSVSWGSSKTSVATVNQYGVVTAVGQGTAVITATTTDGSNLTATCIVTVNPRLATGISVSPTSATLTVGGTKQLTATVLPSNTTNRNVSWRSSNTSVATVSSSGLVTAKGVGSATITATTADGTNLSATCAVTVTPILATSISLNYSEANLEMSSTLTLTATVLPTGASQTVKWKSSSPPIASVDNNGVVTGLGVGTVTITATTTDGTNLSATCTVHVSRPMASSLTLNPTELLLEYGENTQIEAILSPDVALRTLQWSSSNSRVATVDQDGYVTGVDEGYAVIIAKTVDGSNLTATCLVNVVNNRVRGDVNHDGVVDIDDVNLVINLITHRIPDDTYSYSADVDGSGNVDIDDLNIIINIMLDLDKSELTITTQTVNGVTFRMVHVEGGTFTMGATPEQGSDAIATEKPAHQVTLSDYAIGETEVTQALWQAVMGSNPSANTSSPALPVETVSWNDCQTFIAKLNQLTGKTFRLPTEAEWEYAARGGNRSKGYKYAGGNDLDQVAWWKDNSGIQSHPVGQKAPNELKLYDMSGNVYEMVADWYGTYSSDAQTNPTGPATGTMRVSRGGGCNRDQIGQRVSFRGTTSPTSADFVMGLRLAM